jgi:hypothetical protein
MVFVRGHALGLDQCLPQRRLRLWQPERHLHRPVQLGGSGQFGAGLGAASELGIELPEAQMAVGLERAHAEFGAQLKGLPARRDGALEVLLQSLHHGHLGQHPRQ